MTKFKKIFCMLLFFLFGFTITFLGLNKINYKLQKNEASTEQDVFQYINTTQFDKFGNISTTNLKSSTFSNNLLYHNSTPFDKFSNITTTNLKNSTFSDNLLYHNSTPFDKFSNITTTNLKSSTFSDNLLYHNSTPFDKISNITTTNLKSPTFSDNLLYHNSTPFDKISNITTTNLKSPTFSDNLLYHNSTPFDNLYHFKSKKSIINSYAVSNQTENLILTNSSQENISDNVLRKYTFTYSGKKLVFLAKDYLKDLRISNTQKELLTNENEYRELLNRVTEFGLSKSEIVRYFFPEIEVIKERLCKITDISPEENYVQVVKNSCKLSYVYGKKGKFLNQDDFYGKLFECVKNNTKNINIDILVDFYEDTNDIENDFQEKSCFTTNFESSSLPRKNNIRVALEKFDGLVLEQGEVLSFNTVTGERNEKSGYEEAKIISNGTFTTGFGGGVCQVSTTLYNACLLAGLDILEVHNHSLPVSYIEPSFDAMVNSGSSDLVVRNNTDGKIIITTSSKGDKCKIKIFGKKNRYKITRFSEKTKIIPAESDKIDTEYEKYGNLDLEVGEEIRLSYPKDGFYSKGYLKYYDENGVLTQTVQIRENRYGATKGVIVKRES